MKTPLVFWSASSLRKKVFQQSQHHHKTPDISTPAVILYLVILICSLQSVSQLMEPLMSIINTCTCFRKCCCSWGTVAGIWKQTDFHEQRLLNQVCNTLRTHHRLYITRLYITHAHVFSAPNSNRSPSCGHIWYKEIFWKSNTFQITLLLFL